MLEVLPDDLMQRIREAWLKSGDGPPLPDPEAVRQVLDAAFWASMRTEEQRTLSFRVAYCSPADCEADETPQTPVRFGRIRELTAGQLVRLSPALDFRQALVGVCSARELDPAAGDGTVVIWGIIDSGLSWWEHTKGEPRRRVHKTPPPDCFTVSSYQPGTLSLSRRGRVLLALRGGKVAAAIPNLLRTGPVGRFLQVPARRLLDQVTAELGQDFSGFDPRTQQEAEQAYVTFIQRTLASMREAGHGGAVMLVPDDWTADSPAVHERLDIKFPTAIGSTWELLVEYVRRLNLALHATYEALKESTVPRDFFLEYLVTRRQREQSEDNIGDRASLLASFTRVDGCTVLTHSLDTLGFGAEIVMPQTPDLEHVQVAQDAEGQHLEAVPTQHFGTRHRSAFRLCHSHPEILALVLSSDGDLRVVKRVGQQVILWNGLDSPELGL
jgi:hypothetical protein